MIVFVFWFYLFVFLTDVAHMTSGQLLHKIYYDLFQDVGNYDHSLPCALLLVEYFMNNIEFTWTQFAVSFGVHLVYIVFQGTYCITHKVVVYPGIDWNNNLKGCLVMATAILILVCIWSAIFIYATKLKFWVNGLNKHVNFHNKV